MQQQQQLMLLQFHFFACIFHFFRPPPPPLANKVVFAAHLEEHSHDMAAPTPSLKPYFEKKKILDSVSLGVKKSNIVFQNNHTVIRRCLSDAQLL